MKMKHIDTFGIVEQQRLTACSTAQAQKMGVCFFFLFYTRLFEVKINYRKKIYHYFAITEIQLCVNNAWIVLLFFIS